MTKAELEQLRDEWRNRVKDWEESGLTQAEYCRRNSLKIKQFLYWKKKYTPKPSTLPFVQIPITPKTSLSPLTHTSPLCIKIGNRYCIEVDRGFDPMVLEDVVGVLSRL